MSGVRVYVPSTSSRLRQIVAANAIEATPLSAHAVTDGLREEFADAGDEEWEYAAATAAAQSSVGLLGTEEPARRVVLAVDLPRVSAADSDDVTEIRVDDPVPFRRIAAVLADSAEAQRDVAAARDALAAGAEDADHLLERCLDHELGWWAVQEVDVLLEQTGAAPSNR